MKHLSPLRSPRLLAATGLVVVLGLLPWGQSEAARRTLHYDFPSSDLAVYSFEISHSVATEVIRLPPEAEAFDYQPVVDRIAAVETKLSGRLERFVGRAFRDGTLGLVARVVGLSGSVQRSGSSTLLSFPELEGKSVSFRVSTGGELFDSTGWSHLLGAGRGGELARDVLLQSVLRLPVHLPKGSEAQGTSFTLRVPVDSSLERVNFWALRFVQGAAPTDCSQPCWALDYSGDLREESRDKHPARPMAVAGTGRVEGRLVLEGRGRKKALRSHRWTSSWNRTVSTQRADGSLRGELRQEVSSVGSLELAVPEEEP